MKIEIEIWRYVLATWLQCERSCVEVMQKGWLYSTYKINLVIVKCFGSTKRSEVEPGLLKVTRIAQRYESVGLDKHVSWQLDQNTSIIYWHISNIRQFVEQPSFMRHFIYHILPNEYRNKTFHKLCTFPITQPSLLYFKLQILTKYFGFPIKFPPHE